MLNEILIIGGLGTMGAAGWWLLKNRKKKAVEKETPVYIPSARPRQESSSPSESNIPAFAAGLLMDSVLKGLSSSDSRSSESESSWSGGGGYSDGGGSSSSYGDSSSDSGSSGGSSD